jgi:hypothetical protein
MTQKVYRTAQGKTVDLGALMLQNENTRAVGNMKVNARGDLVDGWNRPIDSRTNQVQKQYERQVTNVRDEPVVSSQSNIPSASAPAQTTRSKPPVVEKIPTPEPVQTAAQELSDESQGLAAAIARARQIKQEPITRSGRTSSDASGVRRI